MITDDVAWLLVEACRYLGKPTRALRMCELGNQESGWKLRVPVKAIMEWLGVKHTSIDMNGLDGALKLDLSLELPRELLGQFDIVTNAGTTEHVVTSREFRDQYQAFKSIHDLAAPCSVIIHVLPSENGAHCGCGYVYSHRFFACLATLCNYEMVELYDSKSDANHMACMLFKQRDSRFPSYEDFVKMGEIQITPNHPLYNIPRG